MVYIAELDSSNPRNVMNKERIMRIAKGTGNEVKEVEEMLESCKHVAQTLSGLFKIVGCGRGFSGNINPQLLNRFLQPFNF